MPRQEEESMRRVSKIASLIKDAKEIEFSEIEAWCQVNQGVTGKTVGRYINALTRLGVISFDAHKGIIKYIEKKVE